MENEPSQPADPSMINPQTLIKKMVNDLENEETLIEISTPAAEERWEEARFLLRRLAEVFKRILRRGGLE